MRRSVKSLMALAMAVPMSASMTALSGCDAVSGSKARDNTGAASAQTDTAAVNRTGNEAETGTDANTNTSTDTGTGSGTGGNSSSGGKVVVGYWHCNAETQGGLVVDELVGQFNGSNDHIQVMAEYNPDMCKGLIQNLQAEATAGNSPALIQTGQVFPGYFSNNFSYVSPQETISRFDKEDTGFLQDKFLPSVLKLTVNGQGSQVGTPYSLSNPILYINKDILGEAELAEDGLATWQEVGEFAKTIEEKTGKYGFYMQEPVNFRAQWGPIKGSGARMLTTDTEGKKRVSFATGDGVEVMQPTVDVVKGQTTLHISQEGGCQSFISDSCTMLYTTIARRASAQKGAQFDMVAVKSPLWKDKRHTVPTGGCFLVTTARGDDQVEMAWEFGGFLYNAESMAVWTERAGYVPPRKDVAGAKDRLRTFLAGSKMINATIQQVDEVIPWAAFPGDIGLQAGQVLLNMRDWTLGGQVTIEQGMEAVQGITSQLLAVQ